MYQDRHGHVRTGVVQRRILASAASGVSDFIGMQGGDATRVFIAAGVSEAELGRSDLSLDLGTYVEMMELAATDTRNDNFGLGYGQQFLPSALGLLGEMCMTSPTLGAAVANLAAFHPFHQQATETLFIREGGMLRLEYRILDGRIVRRRQDAELTMGVFANVLRHALGRYWAPDEVHFEHPRPANWQEHEQAFDAPVHFSQRTNALVFRGRHLDHRMPEGDLARLDGLRAELLRVTGSTGGVGFIDRLKGEIRSGLTQGYPGIEEIAQIMGMPRWTLQRRLADQGLNFSDLVREVRREIAALYLRQPHIPIGDIGTLLGYSELSAFSRACSGWFGASPQRMRRMMVS